jgi:hypothetical protein
MSVSDPSEVTSPCPTMLSVHEDALFEVRLWSDMAWLGLSLRERPALLEYVSGVGWVGAVRIRPLDGQPPAAPRPDRRSQVRRTVLVERRSGTDRRRSDRLKSNG